MKKGFDFVGVGVCFFCHDGNGRVLMNKRSQNCRDEQGRWDFGGGGVEFGESIIDAVHRELSEEYSATVLASEFLGYRDVFREQDGKKTHWVAFDFKMHIDPTTVKNAEPHYHDAIERFPFNAMPQPVHSQIPRWLDLYKHKLFS